MVRHQSSKVAAVMLIVPTTGDARSDAANAGMLPTSAALSDTRSLQGEDGRTWY